MSGLAHARRLVDYGSDDPQRRVATTSGPSDYGLVSESSGVCFSWFGRSCPWSFRMKIKSKVLPCACLEVTAIEHDELLGRVSVSEWGTGPIATVDEIVIDPQYRSRGVARQLLDELLGVAAITPEVEEIAVSARRTDPTRIRLFREAGFVPVCADEHGVSLCYFRARKDSGNEDISDWN